LRSRIRENVPFFAEESVRIVAQVAGALHHAHRRRLFHRDIKPENILLEVPSGEPLVVDFGLGMRDRDLDEKSSVGLAGTLPYMSPEQVRGEGHLIDARTDIYTLGVVLYELLTGQRPFRARDRKELIKQIKTVDPRPPRMLNDSIAKELERICLKCLSK